MPDNNSLPEGWGEQKRSESAPWDNAGEWSDTAEDSGFPVIPDAPEFPESQPPHSPKQKHRSSKPKSYPATGRVSNTAVSDNKKTLLLLIIILILVLIIIAGGIVFVLYIRNLPGAQNAFTIENNAVSQKATEASEVYQKPETVPEIVTEAPTEPPTEPPTDPPTEPAMPEYTVVLGKYTWEDAEAYCKSYGGHLATVHSETEWDAMMKAVKEAQQNNAELKYLWLGATSQLSSDMKVSFSWVDGSETNFIMTNTSHWYYNDKIDVREPSGYDAYEYKINGNLIREPYLLLWRGGNSTEWTMNDVPDVSGHENYKSSNMGFIMRIN